MNINGRQSHTKWFISVKRSMTTPAQQNLEGSADTDQTLYSHITNNHPKLDSIDKLEYIYQHFHDSEKAYKSIRPR